MTNLHLLDETVRELERDPNLSRIKKLMFCISQGIWENDEGRLDSLNLRDLIIEVCETTGSLENLKYVINGIIGKINKPQRYATIAKAIVTKVGRLYPEFQEVPTQPDLSSGYYVASTFVLSNDNTSETDFDSHPPDLAKVIEREALFDLRQKILQHTSPLRAKIVIFSTLDRLFEFNRDEDWMYLKKIQIDDLLQQLYEFCPSIETLESQLYQAANNLPEPDENLQAAGTIVQYMTPLYRLIKYGGDRDAALTEAIARNMDADRSTGAPGIDEEDWSGADFSAIANASNVGVEFEETNDDNSEIVSGMMASGADPGDRHRKFSLSTLNGIDPIAQKQALEEKLSEMVNARVREVVTSLEDRLNDLENHISAELHDWDLEEALSLKYEYLGNFINKIRENSSQFIELLIRLEESERNQAIKREEDWQ